MQCLKKQLCLCVGYLHLMTGGQIDILHKKAYIESNVEEIYINRTSLSGSTLKPKF